MDDVCFGRDYEDKFDLECYVSFFCSEDAFIMKNGGLLHFLHQLFSTMEERKDCKLLDFGAGPCIHAVLSASRVCQDITMTEYAEQNREALKKWVRNDKDAHDWSRVLSFVGDLEGKSYSEVEMRTRCAIKEVITCEISDIGVFFNCKGGPYDFIITSSCLNSACRTVEHLKRSVSALSGYIKPGGGLIVIGALGTETSYKVGNYKFFKLPLTKEELTQSVEEAGLKIKMFTSIPFDKPAHSDTEYCFVFAIKDVCN